MSLWPRKVNEPGARFLGAGVIAAVLALGLALVYSIRVGAMAALAGAALLGARHLFHRRRVARALARRRNRAGPIVPIARASGRVRVRGRVHVLVPAALEPDLGAAVVLTRAVKQDFREQLVRDTDGHTRKVLAGHTSIDEHAACGRFAVVDADGGVAVVDEDAFELFVGPLSASATVLALHDGEEVEVIGLARRAPASDDVAPLLRRSAYREVVDVLEYVGEEDERVAIVFTPGAPAA